MDPSDVFAVRLFNNLRATVGAMNQKLLDRWMQEHKNELDGLSEHDRQQRIDDQNRVIHELLEPFL